MKAKSKQPKVDFTYWYPANRQPDDPVFPELERFPVKRRRRVVVPLTSQGHITHNNKLLCGKTKRVAQKERGCATGKSTPTRLAAIDVCAECLQVYNSLDVSEVHKLKAWNNGEGKVF